MIINDKKGGRSIELFLPFDIDGKTVEIIALSPVTLDHTLRWKDGKFKNEIELLAELAGVPEATIRQLRYPDVDRVMVAFFELLPMEIRALMGPQEPAPIYGSEEPQPQPTEPPVASYSPAEPPVEGFDLSDENRR